MIKAVIVCFVASTVLNTVYILSHWGFTTASEVDVIILQLGKQSLDETSNIPRITQLVRRGLLLALIIYFFHLYSGGGANENQKVL